MALLGLPPEILRQIFDQLDSSFFQEDLSRLTVSKKWLDFALPACFKRVNLSYEASYKALRILATSAVAKRSSPLEGHLQTLTLDIKGYQHGFSTHSQENAQPTSRHTAPYIYPWDNSVRDWRVTLDNGLAQLATIAQHSPELRILRVRASSSSLEFPLFPPGGYLSLSTMRALLSVENLSVLVLDLSGTSLNSSGLLVDEHHTCPIIAALLRTLQTLHLRMCRICPEILKTQDPDKKLRLSTVAIDLRLPPDEPSLLPWDHSTPCEPLAGGMIQLKADIQEQAEALVIRMASPKTLRILTHNDRKHETRSLDVLTGKIMRLEDDAAWDEDGETVQEYSEDSEDSELELEFEGFFFE